MRRDILYIVMIFFTVFSIGIIFLDLILESYENYVKISTQIEQDRDMLLICRNTTINSAMAKHTPICTELESRIRIGAFWLAIGSVTWGKHIESLSEGLQKFVQSMSWQVAVCVALCFLFFPGILANTVMRQRRPRDEDIVACYASSRYTPEICNREMKYTKP